MIESTNGMSAADVAAVVGNNRNNNDGIFGGEGGYLLLFLVLLMSGGLWGGNGMFGGMGGGAMWNMGMAPYFYSSQTQNEVSRGFDNSAVNAALAAISASVNGVSQSLCNDFAGVNATVNAGFANAETAANARQMANMNQAFAAQTAISTQLGAMAMNQQNALCENRANIADVKYTIANENCLDRQALSDGVRDIIANQTAGFQSIKDMMCQDKIDAKNERINDLERQLTVSQQNAFFAQGMNAEVDALYNRLKNCPVNSIPVYGSQPIFTCPNNGYNCNGFGCN